MSEEEDILRILIATDNHLGIWENDEVRKDDSFNSFEEIFEIAEREAVDMVLLGGDLFHDNKPTRNTVVRAMDILSRHCLNDRPITFRILSDQTQNFTTGRVNYENPNYNIGLPVFTIHGNHDDPAGSDNLSAVDILATGNLVNYFGKTQIQGEGAGKVRISPILLQKGSTRLALYGLGNIRDERLCRIFSTPNSVEWIRPVSQQPGTSSSIPDWFSLFVLHQNRIAYSKSAKNCVREGHLPGFLDLVVWGHEHECITEPWNSIESNSMFSVMQPGSSVATALSEGESKKKHVMILEVKGDQWRTVKFGLETVRPFAFDTVSLKGQGGNLPDDSKAISDFLEAKVDSMIAKASRSGTPRTPALPLIRLRVDYTGFSTINTQRFAQKFIGKIANPHDIILWQKARVVVPKTQGQRIASNALTEVEDLRIEDLIAKNLQQNLDILPENDLIHALHDYVEKEEKNAIDSMIQRVLKETETATIHEGVVGEKELNNAILMASKKRQDNAAAVGGVRGGAQQRRGGGRGGGRGARGGPNESFMEYLNVPANAVVPADGDDDDIDGFLNDANDVGDLGERRTHALSNTMSMIHDDDDDDQPGTSVRRPPAKRATTSASGRKTRGAKAPKLGDGRGATARKPRGGRATKALPVVDESETSGIDDESDGGGVMDIDDEEEDHRQQQQTTQGRSQYTFGSGFRASQLPSRGTSNWGTFK